MPIVKLYANLRKLAGMKKLFATGSTLGEVLNELVRRNSALDGVILDGGEIRPHFVITVNGHITADLNASVTEQDIIAIFPPIAGGATLTPLPPSGGLPKGRGESRRMNGWLV